MIDLHGPAATRFYMLDVYGKEEMDDLAPQEKKLLRELADQLKQEAIAGYQRLHKDQNS